MPPRKLTQWKPRRITPSIAPVVAYLEQNEKTLVTSRELAELVGLKRSQPRLTELLRALRAAGWLRPLPIRGVYEFLPARTGPYASGDPWLELRSLLLTERNLHLQIALSSAAFLRGYASRAPRRPILLVDKTQSIRPRLREGFKIIRTKPERIFGAETLDGLPVSNATRLLIECVMYWRHAGDLRDRNHWLSLAIKDINVQQARVWAKEIGPGIIAKVAYLLERFGAAELASLFGKSPRGKLFIFGDRHRPGSFSSRWRLYDTIGVATAE